MDMDNGQSRERTFRNRSGGAAASPAFRKFMTFYKWFLVLSLASYLLLIPDVKFQRLSQTQIAAQESRYDLVGWHMGNGVSKWTHWLARAAPGFGVSDWERIELVDRYFELGVEARRLRDELASAPAGSESSAAMARRLEDVRAERLLIRNDVEETIESDVSSVVREHRLGFRGEFVFPPIDVRLEEPPKALITSPRDRIERLETVLLTPEITLDERERIENRITGEQNLSAIVVDVSGVATYPASVYNGGDLRGTLSTVAHEWLHHYMAFKPLGSEMYAEPEMRTLNETVANVAGNEIGDLAYIAFLERKLAHLEQRLDVALRPSPNPIRAVPAPNAAFDFGQAMRETRIVTDRILAAGQIELAESYMERRRRMFNSNGYAIRKINQAFFALHGTYADGPGSVDPIGPQVQLLRALSSDVGEFVTLVAEVGSYAEFLNLLDGMERDAGE